MSRSYADLINRGFARHGSTFSPNGLSTQFIPFYERQARIKVRFSCGTVKTGTVGVTTGWVPCFILMLRKDSIGSSWCLDDRDTILGEVK